MGRQAPLCANMNKMQAPDFIAHIDLFCPKYCLPSSAENDPHNLTGRATHRYFQGVENSVDGPQITPEK